MSRIKFIFFAFLLIGCKTQNQDPYRGEFKEIYIDQFKLVYVKVLFRKCYNNSPQVKQILFEDKSGFTEPILTEADYDFIDSLTTIEKLKIHKDSIESIGTVAEGAEGKHFFNFLIKKIESPDLKKLAKMRYRIAKSK